MFFTPIAPATYRTNARLGLERFLQEVARPQHAPPTQFEQDEHQYRLSMDMPGVSKDHLLVQIEEQMVQINTCLLYTSPSPRDGLLSRMPSSA